MENKHIELLAKVAGCLPDIIEIHNERKAEDKIFSVEQVLSALSALETALNEKHNAELERLKRFDGSDDHPEHRCQRCTGRNLSSWFADNDEWNKIAGDDFGILCPNCFNELSELKGVQPAAWRLSREGDVPLAHKLMEQIFNLKNDLEKHRVEVEGKNVRIKKLEEQLSHGRIIPMPCSHANKVILAADTCNDKRVFCMDCQKVITN